jgi:hypothetical protein
VWTYSEGHDYLSPGGVTSDGINAIWNAPPSYWCSQSGRALEVNQLNQSSSQFRRSERRRLRKASNSGPGTDLRGNRNLAGRINDGPSEPAFQRIDVDRGTGNGRVDLETLQRSIREAPKF